MRRIDPRPRLPRTGRPVRHGLLLCAAVTGCVLAGGGTSSANGTWRGKRPVRGVHTGWMSRAEALNERSYLHLTYVRGNRIVGHGRASGTVAGNGSAQLTLVGANRAVGEFSGSNSRGSVSGRISASYRVAGAVSYFSGSVTSIHGTGKYAGARSLSIRFSGTLNRPKLTLTMSAVGVWQR